MFCEVYLTYVYGYRNTPTKVFEVGLQSKPLLLVFVMFFVNDIIFDGGVRTCTVYMMGFMKLIAGEKLYGSAQIV